MTDLNHVAIIGRLTRDPDGISYMPNGNAVLKFSIAVNRRKKTGDQWTEEASYFDVTLFGKSAESDSVPRTTEIRDQSGYQCGQSNSQHAGDYTFFVCADLDPLLRSGEAPRE